MTREQHPHAKSREWALQFLYQSEIEKVHFFSATHFDRFVSDFHVEPQVAPYLKTLVVGVFENLQVLNEKIESQSDNWNLSRMPVVDRSILRLATFEMMFGQTPHRVVINEAIELAKKYSTEHSGSFVNGILDKLKKQE